MESVSSTETVAIGGSSKLYRVAAVFAYVDALLEIAGGCTLLPGMQNYALRLFVGVVDELVLIPVIYALYQLLRAGGQKLSLVAAILWAVSMVLYIIVAVGRPGGDVQRTLSIMSAVTLAGWLVLVGYLGLRSGLLPTGLAYLSVTSALAFVLTYGLELMTEPSNPVVLVWWIIWTIIGVAWSLWLGTELWGVAESFKYRQMTS